MKRSYTYLKGLLTLALAAFTGWMWAAGESISIKLNSGTFDANTNYGCYPVKGADWQVVGGGAKVDNIALKNNVKVSYTSSAVWSMSWSNHSAHVLLDAYLDDEAVDGHGTEITVSGLDTTTFANYDVLIYMTADTTPSVGHDFVAPTVNGTQYTQGGAGSANWGTKDSPHEPRIGINCLLVKGLQATADNNTLTISVPAVTDRDAGRASISAIQIVQSGSVTSTVFDSAVSEWTFENSIADLRGKLAGWTGDNSTTNAFVESLRKNVSGEPYTAAKMSAALHPYANGYVWPDQVTIAVYANLEKCPDNGALVSSGGATRLRKLDANTIFFGKNTNVTADLETLSKGYHLIIASRDVTNRKLTLQIDNGEPVVVNDISNISDGIQLGADWAGGTHSYDDNGGAIFDDVLIWDKILTSEEIAQLVAAYPAVIPPTAEAAPTGVGPHKLSTLIENGLTTGSDIVATITLANGATLEIDTATTFNELNIVTEGSVTVKVTDLAISQAQLDEMNLNIDSNKVILNYTETIGYTVGDVTYSLVYRGPADGWGTAANWYTGYRTNGTDTYWIPYSGSVPAIPGGNLGATLLIDGDLIGDKITADDDGYKVVNTPTLEGWALTITIANGVHVKVPTMNKLQGTCAINVDDTSKMTVTSKGSGNNDINNAYYIEAENGLVFENMPMPGGTAYLGLNGSITTGTFANQQTIGGVMLDLGDSTLPGRKIVTRTLYTYTSGTTFSVAEGAVTTSVDTVTPEATEILQTVGQYKFEKKADGYYVDYVAYAEADEIGEPPTWTNASGDGTWENSENWKNGELPADGDEVIVNIESNQTLAIPEGGKTVALLMVTGEGTLTITGGKITVSNKVLMDGANISSDAIVFGGMYKVEGVQGTENFTMTVNGTDLYTRDMAFKNCKLTKNGTGTYALSAQGHELENVEATIAAGTLKLVMKNNADPTVVNSTINFANGTTLEQNGWIRGENTTLTLHAGEGVTATAFSTNIAGFSMLKKTGAGTLAANINGTPENFNGEIRVEGGTLQMRGPNLSSNKITTVAGTTLEFSGDATITHTGNSIAGLLKVTSGTVTHNGADKGVNSIEVAAGATLISSAADGLNYSSTTTATIDGKLHLKNRWTIFSGNSFYVSGELASDDNNFGDYYCAYDFYNNASNDDSHAKLYVTGPNAKITGRWGAHDPSKTLDVVFNSNDAKLTITKASTGNQHVTTMLGTDVTSGEIAIDVAIGTQKLLTIAKGVTLSGSGSWDGPLTFNDGAKLVSSFTVTGDVTLSGAVTVSGEAGATVLTCANAESLDLTKFTAPEGLTCIAEDDAVKLAVAKKTNFVVTVGEETVNCETVAEALGALAAGGSLQIAEDADPEALALTETLTIAANTTIDLNGKTLTSTADPAIHVTGGTLTLTGEGSITAPGVVIQQGTKSAGLTTKVVVAEGVTLSSFRTEGEDYDGDNVVLLYGKATLESAGVLLTYSKGYAAIQGSGGDAGAETAITITGGQVVNNGDVAIYQPQAGTLTITGGVISGSTAIYAKAGTISISGGEISGTGAQNAYGENHNGCGSTGDALVVDTTAGYATPTVSITGGTFTSDNAAAVASYAGAGQTAATGIVKADATATFSSDVSDLCEAGYKTEANAEGVYGVVEDPAYGKVAKVGEDYYATLAEAIENATAGQTITLLAGVTINSRLDIAQNVTIDLNGQTIAETMEDQFGAIYVKKGATLTIAATNGGEITTDGGIVIGNYGTVIVDGGTIAAGEDAETDVSIYNFYYQADWYGTTTINGGTVARIWNCGVATLADGEVTDVDNSGAMTITDATVTNIILRDGTDAPGIEGAGTLTAPEGLTVTTLDGQKAVYADGKYTVVKILTLPEELVDSPAAEAIEAAMEAVGVTEITKCIIVTKGAGADATAEVVANVLEVFEVTPTVDANGVLTVTYEFGISKMTKAGDTITITAGVTGAEYREGVTVGFYADGEEVIGTATTGADSTEVSITADAANLNGKKITVKATK